MIIEDKAGRKIRLTEGNDTIWASYNGGCIGEFSLYVTRIGGEHEPEKTVAVPHVMNINEGYRRSGIGTAMMEYAKTLYDIVRFADDVGTVEDKNDIHYTDAGLQFKHYCEYNNITSKPYYGDDGEYIDG